MENRLPQVAQKAPFKFMVEAGKKYYWCSCGLSKKQPFCDGAHKMTSFTPNVFEASETKMVYFCGCKHSNKGTVCDGAHNKL